MLEGQPPDFFRNLRVADWKCVSGPFHPNKAPTLMDGDAGYVSVIGSPQEISAHFGKGRPQPLVLSMVILHVFFKSWDDS